MAQKNQYYRIISIMLSLSLSNDVNRTEYYTVHNIYLYSLFANHKTIRISQNTEEDPSRLC